MMLQESEQAEPPGSTPRKRSGGRPLRSRTDAGVIAAIAAAGSLGALARIAGVTSGAVSVWTHVPERVLQNVADGLSISRHALRPDLFDAQDQPITPTPKEAKDGEAA
jgi:hypothetical protein